MKLELLLSTKVFLAVGSLFLILLALLRKDKYCLSLRQAILSLVFVVIAGISGLFLMYYIENGAFGGISFFGTILIGPILLFPLIKMIKASYINVLSLIAPCVCLFLIVMKYNCYSINCCFGNEFYKSITSFPLQLLELFVALFIMVLLLILERKEQLRDFIYPIFLIVYGVTRFVINGFRSGLKVFYILPPGHLWSVVSVVAGIVFIIGLYVFKRRNECDLNEKGE